MNKNSKKKVQKENSLIHFGKICKYFPDLKNIFDEPAWKKAKVSKELKNEIESFIQNSNNYELNQILLEVGIRVTTSDDCLDIILQECYDIMQNVIKNGEILDKNYICNLLIKLECNFQKIYMIVACAINFFAERHLLADWETAKELTNTFCAVLIDIIEKYKKENNILY